MDAEQRHNPADLPLVTLDNNALIAVRENEPAAETVNKLLAMNRARRIIINITLSTGLEAGRGGVRREWAEHIAWLESLGIGKSNIFTGPRTIGFISLTEPGVTYFDCAFETQFNERIHHILFPKIPFYWDDFRDAQCACAGLPVQAIAEYDLSQRPFYIPLTPHHPRKAPTPHFDALSTEEQLRVQDLHRRLKHIWHNAKNDALGLYNHLTTAAYTNHPEWSVFVTDDKNFLKPAKLTQMRALGFKGEILPPGETVSFLRTVVVRHINM